MRGGSLVMGTGQLSTPKSPKSRRSVDKIDFQEGDWRTWTLFGAPVAALTTFCNCKAPIPARILKSVLDPIGNNSPT